MEKSIIKYKGISYSTGKNVSFKKTYTHPVFKEYEINDIENIELAFPVTVTRESQILDWLDEIDKADLLIEHDLMCILDYDVFVPKKKVPKKDQIIKILKEPSLDISEDFLYDFIAVYKEMEKEIKSLKIDKQIAIVMRSMSVGYKTAMATLDRIKQVRLDFEENKEDKYLDK